MTAVAAALGAHTSASVAVSGMTASSSQTRPGDLFAGVPGAHGHGARFAPIAVAAGASAVLTDKLGAELVDPAIPVVLVDDVRAALGPAASFIYGSPSSKLAVLGVTGTSGKTTTTYLMRAGLAAVGIESALIGTVATLIGSDALSTGFTTPEAPELQALLAVILERGITSVAMEVSSHALAMDRVAGVEFRVGAFTNLSRDHLDFHSDMEDYFAAKAKLFDGRARRAVVVTDDEWGVRLADRLDCVRGEHQRRRCAMARGRHQ